MKKVLFIYPDYPPRTQSGGIRASRLAKYLSGYEWDAHVLTILHSKSGISGLTDVQRENQVTRVPVLDLSKPGEIAGKFISFFRSLSWKVKPRPEVGGSEPGNVIGQRRFAKYIIPDPEVFWVPGAIRAGHKHLRLNSVDVIYSSSPSPSTLLVGYFLQKRHAVPWIIEFRDPWVANPFREPRPFGCLDWLEHRLEKFLVCRATKIVVTSNYYREIFLKKYPSLKEENLKWISNGFDPDDYKNIKPVKFDHFTIVHAGKFYGDRTSSWFLRGLMQLFENNPELIPLIKVIFVGTIDSEGYSLLSEQPLQGIIQLKGTVPHAETLRIVAGADVNLLIPGPGKGTMPAKIFEQIAVAKPILALVDEGPALELISNHKVGLCVPATDISSIADAVKTLWGAYEAKRQGDFDHAELLARYAYPDISRRVGAVLDSVINQPLPEKKLG